MPTAQEHKEQGNEALKAGRFEDAVRSYTKAVEADSEDPTFYCNRAIAYTKMGHFEKAVSDAEDAIGVNPRHMKAYSVGGTALLLHGKKDDALRMYRRGLGLEPDNALLKERVRQAERHHGSARGPSSRPMPSAWGGSATGIPPETGLRPGQGLPTGAASLQAMATSSRLATLLTVQGALRSFMLLQTILYVVPLLISPATAFRYFLMAAIANYGVGAFAAHGTPRWNAEYGRRVVLDPSMHYLFLCFMFLVSRPFVLALALILLGELPHLAYFAHTVAAIQSPALAQTMAAASTRLLPTVLGVPNFASLSPAVRWNEVNTFVRKTTALMEVGTGVLLILELLTPYRNILALVMYWQFLRVRAILSPYTKDAFRALDRRILSLTSHNACPALIRNGYQKVRSAAAKMAETPQPGQQPAGGGGMSSCTIV